MTDRREVDPAIELVKQTVTILQRDVEGLAPLPEALGKLNTSIEILNNTLKILGIVFSVVFPVLCAWNYYLGKGVTGLENIVGKHEVQLRNIEVQAEKAQMRIDAIRESQRK